MLKKIAILFLFPLYLFGDVTVAQSEEVQFDDKKMVLKGSVSLEHDMGKISAQEITLMPGEKDSQMKFRFAELKGNVVFALGNSGTVHSEAAKIDFVGRSALFYNEGNDVLVEYTKGSDEDMPLVVTSKRMLVEFHHKKTDHKELLKKVNVDGDVHIRYKDNLYLTGDFGEYDRDHHLFSLRNKTDDKACQIRDKGETFSLICPGEIIIDENNLQAILIGPRDDIERQVYFNDSHGKAFANTATMDYVVSENNLIPKKMSLQGGVRIIKGEGTLLQYVLADDAVYYPESKNMRFAANKGNRVLFYDRPNNMEISAPEMKITRNTKTKKDIIKGYGDVRFNLQEEELNLIRKRFQLQKEDSKNE